MSGTLRRAQLQRALLQRSLAEVSVGGSAWTVTHASGAAASSVTGYAYQEAQDTMPALEHLPGGIRAPSQPWRFVLKSGSLTEGDAIVSASDSSVRFTVRQPERGVLYPTAIIEPIGPMTITTP